MRGVRKGLLYSFSVLSLLDSWSHAKNEVSIAAPRRKPPTRVPDTGVERREGSAEDDGVKTSPPVPPTASTPPSPDSATPTAARKIS